MRLSTFVMLLACATAAAAAESPPNGETTTFPRYASKPVIEDYFPLGGAAVDPGVRAEILAGTTKVSSALGPLFKKAREQDLKQAQRSQDFIFQLGQIVGRALGSGGHEPDDTPYSTYVQLSRSLGSSGSERKTLQAAVQSGLVRMDQRAANP